MAQENNSANLNQEVLIDGKKYKLTGLVDFSNLQITKIGEDITDPEPPVEPVDPTNPTEPVDPKKPTEGVIKPGGWGANTSDRGAWKVVNMRNPPDLFKVVDGVGKNVATNFTTKEVAENFILYFQTHPFPPVETTEPTNPPPTEPPVTGGTGTTDKNGVQLLFAKPENVNYNVEKDTRDSKKDGIRWNWKIDGAAQSEVWGYFRFKQNPVDDEVSAKWSEKSHSGSAEVQCYDSGVSIKTGKARIRFENPHPDYTKELGGTNSGGIPLGTKWIGYRGVKKVNADGTVTISLYQDQGDNEGAKPANQWKKIFEYTDSEYKRTGAQPYITLRIDDPAKKGQKDLEEKWLGAAAIK